MAWQVQMVQQQLEQQQQQQHMLEQQHHHHHHHAQQHMMEQHQQHMGHEQPPQPGDGSEMLAMEGGHDMGGLPDGVAQAPVNIAVNMRAFS